MTNHESRQLEDELARLRRWRDATLTILRREMLSDEEKLHAIERVLQSKRDDGNRDEDSEAEEARDRERLS